MCRAVSIIGTLFILSSCSLLKVPGKGGGSGAAASGSKGWSQTFTEAPSYKLGAPVEVKAPPCSDNGYIKLDIEQDKPFHFTTKSPQAGSSCAYVEVLNGKAQAANTAKASADVCGESKTIESKGQEGGTYIVIQERYGCSGITVSLAIAEGPAPAPGSATAPAANDTPKPEN